MDGWEGCDNGWNASREKYEWLNLGSACMRASSRIPQLVCDTFDTFHNNKMSEGTAYYTGIGQKVPESHNKMMSKSDWTRLCSKWFYFKKLRSRKAMAEMKTEVGSWWGQICWLDMGAGGPGGVGNVLCRDLAGATRVWVHWAVSNMCALYTEMDAPPWVRFWFKQPTFFLNAFLPVPGGHSRHFLMHSLGKLFQGIVWQNTLFKPLNAMWSHPTFLENDCCPWK